MKFASYFCPVLPRVSKTLLVKAAWHGISACHPALLAVKAVARAKPTLTTALGHTGKDRRTPRYVCPPPPRQRRPGWYRAVGSEYQRALGDLLIMTSPVMPCLASEMWAGFVAGSRCQHDEHRLVSSGDKVRALGM